MRVRVRTRSGEARRLACASVDHALCTCLHDWATCFQPRSSKLTQQLSPNMKRGAPTLEDGASSLKQRRTISYSTFRKWQTELDKDCQTVTWLECDKTATGTVTALKCGICIRFQSAIERRRNYSDRWVIGAESLRTSNIRDHAKTDQHQHAMMLWKKQQATARGLGPSAYSPIA